MELSKLNKIKPESVIFGQNVQYPFYHTLCIVWRCPPLVFMTSILIGTFLFTPFLSWLQSTAAQRQVRSIVVGICVKLIFFTPIAVK